MKLKPLMRLFCRTALSVAVCLVVSLTIRDYRYRQAARLADENQQQTPAYQARQAEYLTSVEEYARQVFEADYRRRAQAVIDKQNLESLNFDK